MGIRIQVENFGNEKSCRFQFLERCYNYGLHMHQFAELFVLIDGELEVTVNDRKEMLHSGDAALILPYQPHKFYSKVQDKVGIFVFSEALVPEFFNTVNGMTSSTSVFKLKDSTLAALKDRVISNGDFSVYDIKGALYFALGDFLEQVPLYQKTEKLNLPAGFMKYVSDNLTSEITLDMAAKALGYSPKHLSLLLKKLFDMNFTKIIANVRVNRARHLLRETSKERSAICYECGFGSERSFHRQFKEIVGCTPNEYRALELSKVEASRLKNF